MGELLVSFRARSGCPRSGLDYDRAEDGALVPGGCILAGDGATVACNSGLERVEYTGQQERDPVRGGVAGSRYFTMIELSTEARGQIGD